MKHPTALIIEDDKKLANIYSLALKAAKFETEIILHGSAALDRLADSEPALVLLDVHLPQVSGEDILNHIRADERLSETPVILTTGDVLMAEQLRAQADLILLKPVSITQLSDLARHLLPVEISG